MSNVRNKLLLLKFFSMNVFKFGGASVKDANAVRNVLNILQLYKGKKLGVVISAMGKTTNAMEKIVEALWNRSEDQFIELVEERRAFHMNIMNELFSSTENGIYAEINAEFDQLLEKFNDPVPVIVLVGAMTTRA